MKKTAVFALLFAARTYAAGVCKPPIDLKKDVLIDVLTGDQAGGPVNFKKNDNVRLVFYNINPFAYQYKFTTKMTAKDDSSALSKFLSLLGGVVGDVTAVTSPAGPSVAINERLAASPLADVKTKLQNFQTALRSAKADYDFIRSPGLVCEDVLAKAKDLSDSANSYISARQQLVNAISTLRDDISVSSQTTPDDKEVVANKKSFADKADRALSDTTADDKALRAAETAANVVKSTGERVSDDNPFYLVRYVGRVDSPSLIKISIARKDSAATSDFQTFVDPTISVGGSARFALGAGIGFTPLAKIDYVRVQGAQTPADAPGNLMSLIGVDERSTSRITPLAVLHARILDFDKSWFDGLYLSLGVTAKNDKKGTDIDYLIGPSLSMMEHRLFLTAGAYAGKKQSLEGNLHPGQAVPATLAEIPVRKDIHWSVGFAITYAFPIKSK